MAAPTLTGQGTHLGSTTATVTPVIPTHATGDILVCVAESWAPTGATSTNMTLSAGWTIESSVTVVRRLDVEVDGQWIFAWKRAASGAETNPTVTRTGDTGTDTSFGARVFVISGCIATGDPWDDLVSSTFHTAANGDMPAVTVSGTERMIVQFFISADNLTSGADQGDYVAGTHASSTSGLDSASQTFRIDNTSTSVGVVASAAAAPAQGGYVFFGVSFKPPVPLYPPTRVDVVAADPSVAVATGVAKSTPSLSWNADDLIVVLAVSEDGNIVVNTPTATGLTFNPIMAGVGAAGVNCWVRAWSAVAGSSGSGVISATHSVSGSYRFGLLAGQYRGTNGVGLSSALVRGTTNTIPLNTTGGSAVLEAQGDWSAGTAGFTGTPASPTPTEHADGTAGGAYTYFMADWLDVAGGSQNWGIASAASRNWTHVVVEVLGSETLPSFIEGAWGTIQAF